MSTTYTTIGEAVYDFAAEINISSATPDGYDGDLEWGDTLNRPPKANELNVYPALVVMPSGDSQETGDTNVDFDSVTYSVYVVFSYAEASFAEQTLRDVADIVRTQFRTLRADPEELHASAFDISFAGEWGGTLEQGERYYKLDVTVSVHETLLPP